jgi:two-component system, NarL family, response regulator DesR
VSPIVRLAVVEDQVFTRQTTIEIIQARFGPPHEVIGFATVEALLEAGAERFDLVVLDLQLRDGELEGRAAVEAVARHAKVLVFSGLASGEALQRAQAAGARGYVSKDTAEVEYLVHGIDAVLAGAHFVDPALLAQIGASARKQLTPRQQEVLRLEALGCKVPQIALALDPPLTSAGVRRHIERIVQIHPDCAKQADRVRLAIDLGLATPWEVSLRHGDQAS